MPLARSHAESLQRHLRIHEERIATLRLHLARVLESETREQGPVGGGGKERGSDTRQQGGKPARDPNRKVRTPEWVASQREMLEREIRLHEQLLTLGRDPKVLDALGELAENRRYATEVARDPNDAARKRGIKLPEHMTLRLDLEPNRVQLQIISHEDLFPFLVTWNSDSGFAPPPDSGASHDGNSGVPSA
jgi:hypothetical protein